MTSLSKNSTTYTSTMSIYYSHRSDSRNAVMEGEGEWTAGTVPGPDAANARYRVHVAGSTCPLGTASGIPFSTHIIITAYTIPLHFGCRGHVEPDMCKKKENGWPVQCAVQHSKANSNSQSNKGPTSCQSNPQESTESTGFM